MKVTKRNGEQQDASFDKITKRYRLLSEGSNIDGGSLTPLSIDVAKLSQKVIGHITNGIDTSMLDNIAADAASYIEPYNLDYEKLAGRILVSDLHKKVSLSFTETMLKFHEFGMLNETFVETIKTYGTKLDEEIMKIRDYDFSYMSIKILMRSYLLNRNGVQETPQYMYMRAAVAIHGTGDWDGLINTYQQLATHKLSHATPTLFNSGLKLQQMSSCFLLTMKEDSIEGIFDTLKDCALISKTAGGIGLDVTDIRAFGSLIHGTNGKSNGISPMLSMFNSASEYVDQGGGKRKGSWAMYMEPWHLDIFEWLDLGRKTGNEGHTAPNLFYALWVPDLFMERIKKGEPWTLFCPTVTGEVKDGSGNLKKSLHDLYGDEFKARYEELEQDESIPKDRRRTIDITTLVQRMMMLMVETGTPYFLFKDAINRKSNHKHLGTIRSSNLCTEIVQYTSPEETAVCNLASINLVEFIKNGEFDYEDMMNTVKQAVINLDKLIDITYYPIKEARNSNLRHRPMSVGIMGLATTFMKMGYPYDSQEARDMNMKIAQYIQLACCETTCELAVQKGAYPTHQGSPESQGLLQHDLWGVKCLPELEERFAKVREMMKTTGARNSLRTGYMPTASTANINNVSEAFDPFNSNIFARQSGTGDFLQVNSHLVECLSKEGLWSEEMMDRITLAEGSIQDIEEIPSNIRELFKTVWEIRPSKLIDMEADRGAFIDQTQSASRYTRDPNSKLIMTILFYAWNAGLKTGMYYLRTRPKGDAPKHAPTLKRTKSQEEEAKRVKEAPACEWKPGDPACLSCSS